MALEKIVTLSVLLSAIHIDKLLSQSRDYSVDDWVLSSTHPTTAPNSKPSDKLASDCAFIDIETG